MGRGRSTIVILVALLAAIAGLDLVAAGWIATSLGAHREEPAGGVTGGVALASPRATAVATPVATTAPSALAPSAPDSPSPSATGAATQPPPPPTPAPTAVPSAPSAVVPVAGDPAQAVLAFYHAVALHQWSTAIALWTPSMQQRYPPDVYIVQRFTPTTLITVQGLGTTRLDRGAGTATVAVTVTEQRSSGPSPLVSKGSWDVVALNGAWLLDQPHF